MSQLRRPTSQAMRRLIDERRQDAVYQVKRVDAERTILKRLIRDLNRWLVIEETRPPWEPQP